KTRMEMLHGGQPSFGLPRRDLEDLLLRAVRNAGGRVEMGVHVRSFEKKGADWILGVRQMSGLDLTAGASIPPNAQERACSLLVLADGRLSMIQNIPPHSPPRIGRSCYGWNVAFENVPQAPGDLSMHFYPGGYVGVMTFSTGESNVSGIVFTDGPPPRPWSDAFKAAQERQPSLRRLLRDARPVGEWHGVGPLPFTTRMRPDQGAFLAGDAAAVGDPFMGEGIGRALGAGPLLYECFRNAQNRSLEQIRQNYRQRWTNLYSARLRLGWVLRETLRRPILAARATGFLLQNDWSIRALLPLFHRGFSSPPI
ncbi:MAG: hypothetical protein HY548_02470, partial [Elusimicrobia bacterium]|nr:hypothetical protein [Elusimicrobiota bacterium]